MIAVTVHTTGVNWDAIIANVAAMVVIIGAFGTMVSRSIRHGIKEEIEKIIHSDVTPTLNEIKGELHNHSTRIARLEGIDEGRRLTIDQAGVTKT